MDNSGQTAAEFILLFGGIIVVVLLVIFMYNRYMEDLGGQINSNEVNEFNNQINSFNRYFK